VQRRTQFRNPLFSWSRQPEAGPDARFGHRLLHPIALIAVIAFVLVDVFLVVRLTRDDPSIPARPAGSFEGSGSVETADPLDDQLGDLGQTRIGAPIIAGKVVAHLEGNDRSERKPRKDATAADGGSDTVVSSSTSSSGTTSGGSTSGGGSSSGGSDTGGSGTGGSGTGGSDTGGTGTGGGGSGGGGSGGGGSGGDDSSGGGGAAGGGGGGG
jgi:hypothetical protein